MCSTGIKTFFYLFFILSITCYIIDVFSFSFMFFPIERSILTKKQNGKLIYYSNLQTVLYLSFSQVLLGG